MSKKFVGKEVQSEESTKVIKAIPKNEEQAMALKAIDQNFITILDGPAGAGKTHIAVSYALQMLVREKYDKIILTRPIVEAGESLGHLPGDVKEKTDVYMLPIYDILVKYISQKCVDKFIEEGKIVSRPLAYMRGFTAEKCIAILDEAQNATLKQLHMFLTRLGGDAKMIITGDTVQTDIKNSGLSDIMGIIEGIQGVQIVKLSEQAVVRNPIIVEIGRRIEQFNRHR